MMKKFFVLAFALSLLPVVAESNQPVDKMLNCSWWCDKAGHHDGNSSFLPLEDQLKCKDLDELGGQPAITLAVSQNVKVWAEKKFPPTPRYYLSAIPKRGLSQDVLMKQRQDKVLERLNELRSVIMDAYGQCLVLNIETTDFDEMEKKYAVMISSKNWKELGARDSTKSLNAGKWLLDQISKKRVEDVKHVYAKILIAKTARYQDFAAKHPETAQTAVATQRAKKAERRAADAEFRAMNAEMEAAAARQEAANAAAAAASAQSEAAAANRRAADAQFQLDTGVRW